VGKRRRDFSRWLGGLLHDLALIEWSKFDALTGLRAAAFVTAPLLIGAATGYLSQGLFATIGANFLVNTEGSGPSAARLRVLAVACVIEPAALALGTLIGIAGYLAVPLVGLAVFALLMGRTSQYWKQVGLISAVALVAGVGLPGASLSGATERFWASMAGDFWILLGLVILSDLRRRRSAGGGMPDMSATQSLRHAHPFLSDLSVESEAFRQAVVTGIACSVGLALGLTLGLPRDIWILITIVIAIRPGIGPTIDSTVILITGTGIGAVVAAAVTLGTSSLNVLGILLFGFAFVMYSSRLVSQALFQAFLTPFLIVLLNILYPGDWWFALVRIADVTIGGLVAIAAVYLLSLEFRSTGGAGSSHP
jgi:hypothetical protein